MTDDHAGRGQRQEEPRLETGEMIRIPVATAIVLVFLSSCSEGSDITPEPSSPPAPLPDASHSSDDQRRAEAAVLKIADVGKGFRGAPQPADQRADEDDAVLSRCLGRPPVRTRETARALSEAFTKETAQRIRAGVSFVTTEREAVADLRALQSDGAPRCLESLMRADLERQGSEVEVRVNRLSLPIKNSAAFSIIVIAAAENGQKIPTATDYVAAIKGRGEVDAYFQDINGHVEEKVMSRMMTVMLDRL